MIRFRRPVWNARGIDLEKFKEFFGGSLPLLSPTRLGPGTISTRSRSFYRRATSFFVFRWKVNLVLWILVRRRGIQQGFEIILVFSLKLLDSLPEFFLFAHLHRDTGRHAFWFIATGVTPWGVTRGIRRANGVVLGTLVVLILNRDHSGIRSIIGIIGREISRIWAPRGWLVVTRI